MEYEYDKLIMSEANLYEFLDFLFSEFEFLKKYKKSTFSKIVKLLENKVVKLQMEELRKDNKDTTRKDFNDLRNLIEKFKAKTLTL